MIGMNIIFALSPSSGIDWTAHLGGMGFGWLFLKLYSLGGLDRVRGWVSSVPDESEDMPRAVPRTRSSMRDRARGVDEVVTRSNAVVLRESKPLQHVPKQETPTEYAARVNGWFREFNMRDYKTTAMVCAAFAAGMMYAVACTTSPVSGSAPSGP